MTNSGGRGLLRFVRDSDQELQEAAVAGKGPSGMNDPWALYTDQVVVTWQNYLAVLERPLLAELKNLLAKPQLPYNPYPPLVARARHESAKLSLPRSHRVLSELLQRQVLHRVAGDVFEAVDELGEKAWGLSGLLQLVDLPSLRGLRAWVETVSAHHERKVPDFPSTECDLCLSLGGSAVFGRLLPHACGYVLRFDYIATGSDVDPAFGLFVHYIFDHAINITANRGAVFDTLVVPTEQGLREWGPDTFFEDREAVFDAILQVAIQWLTRDIMLAWN